MHDSGSEHTRTDLALAHHAALVGACLGLGYFERVGRLAQELKQDGSIVTQADRAVEEVVRDVLLSERSADTFMGEETGESGSGRRRWILDGIDGTAVFVKGDNRWQTLIALEEDGHIVLGVAVVPAQGQIWWAQRGAGAFVADFKGSRIGAARRLSVGEAPGSLSECRLGVLPPIESLPAHYRESLNPLTALVSPQAWSAHAALLVAAGDLDIAVQVGGAVWDYAALSLIVEEAGGRFSGIEGHAHPVVGTAVFSNGVAVHALALAQLTP